MAIKSGDSKFRLHLLDIAVIIIFTRLRSNQNGRHITYIFKCISRNENCCIFVSNFTALSSEITK